MSQAFRYSSFEVVRKLQAPILSARMICFLKATFNTIRSQVRRSKALVWSGSKLRRMSLPSTAGLTWSNVLPVDLRLHANAPVFCDVIIEFCLMESPHCSHHYRKAKKLALFAKEPDQHQSLCQRLAANTLSLASMNTVMFKTDLMNTAIFFRSH